MIFDHRRPEQGAGLCTCLWNGTPDDFKGNLSKFADSDKGKKLDRVCTKYSNWE